jgi:hypothetical protein
MRATLLALSLLLLALPAVAADADYNGWVTHFYQTRDVGQFDGYWKMVVRDGLLEKKNAIPPVVGFTSQVLHRYPELLKGRFENLSSFPEAQRPELVTILWLSDTAGARAILDASGERQYASKPPPGIAGWRIKSGGDLDLCWGWFFATGDVAALDSIIAALDLGKYSGALKAYATSQKTEEDRQAAINDAIFGAALWSLGVNGRDNHDIAKHIAILFFRDQTPKDRKVWLGVLFAQTSANIPTKELEDDKAGR